MLFGVALGVLHGAVTLATLSLLSTNNESKEDKVVSVAAVMSQSANLSKAKEIWDSVNFPLYSCCSDCYDEDDGSCSVHMNHWITEIYHNLKLLSKSDENDGILSLTQFSRFLHLSVPDKVRIKAAFYGTILLDLYQQQSLDMTHSDILFALGKYITDEKMLEESVEIDVQGNGSDSIPLQSLLPSAVLQVLSNKGLLVRNVKYGSYLYISDSGKKKEMLLWKRPVFINEAQARFLLPSNFIDNIEAEFIASFDLVNPWTTGKKVATQSDAKNSTRKNSQEIVIVPSSSSPSTNVQHLTTTWRIGIDAKNMSSVTLYQNIDTTIFFLCAADSKFDVDEFRSNVNFTVLSPFDASRQPKCLWNLYI